MCVRIYVMIYSLAAQLCYTGDNTVHVELRGVKQMHAIYFYIEAYL